MKDVLKTDCTRAHLYADENDLSKEEKTDAKGENEGTCNVGSNHRHCCGKRDGGLSKSRVGL